MYKFHDDGTLPQNGEVWVFGSNLIGVHGAGAAKVAREEFGAPMGAGMGLMGKAYAIPTKDRKIETLPLSTIKFFAEQFVDFTYHFQDLDFFVTRVGCGLAGYSDDQIAPMFRHCNFNNCSFPKQWEHLL
jgi:hypothetical protein